MGAGALVTGILSLGCVANATEKPSSVASNSTHQRRRKMRRYSIGPICRSPPDIPLLAHTVSPRRVVVRLFPQDLGGYSVPGGLEMARSDGSRASRPIDSPENAPCRRRYRLTVRGAVPGRRVRCRASQ